MMSTTKDNGLPTIVRPFFWHPQSVGDATKRGFAATFHGRAKGCGARFGGSHVAFGRTRIASIQNVENGTVPEAFLVGDILVAPRFNVKWSYLMMRAGGVVLDIEPSEGTARVLACRHHVALVVGIPNAGQFIEGEIIYLTAEGRVAADVKRET